MKKDRKKSNKLLQKYLDLENMIKLSEDQRRYKTEVKLTAVVESLDAAGSFDG